MKKTIYFILMSFFLSRPAISGGILDFMVASPPSNTSVITGSNAPVRNSGQNQNSVSVLSTSPENIAVGSTSVNNQSSSNVNNSIPVHCSSPLLIEREQVISYLQLTCKPLGNTNVQPFTSIPLGESLAIYSLRVLARYHASSGQPYFGNDDTGNEFRLDIGSREQSFLYTRHFETNELGNPKSEPYFLSSESPILILGQGLNLQARLWTVQRVVDSRFDSIGDRYREAEISDQLYSLDLWGTLSVAR